MLRLLRRFFRRIFGEPAWLKRFRMEVELISKHGGRIIHAEECNNGYIMLFELRGVKYIQKCRAVGAFVSCYTKTWEGEWLGC